MQAPSINRQHTYNHPHYGPTTYIPTLSYLLTGMSLIQAPTTYSVFTYLGRSGLVRVGQRQDVVTLPYMLTITIPPIHQVGTYRYHYVYIVSYVSFSNRSTNHFAVHGMSRGSTCYHCTYLLAAIFIHFGLSLQIQKYLSQHEQVPGRYLPTWMG